MILTDTVFSMDGDIAPLDDNCINCVRNIIAISMVDEAHATGVLRTKLGVVLSELCWQSSK